MRWKPRYSCNLNSEDTCHHLCGILFIGSVSLCPTNKQQKGIVQGTRIGRWGYCRPFKRLPITHRVWNKCCFLLHMPTFPSLPVGNTQPLILFSFLPLFEGTLSFLRVHVACCCPEYLFLITFFFNFLMYSSHSAL